MKTTAIILLAGNSTRFSSTTPKQFFKIAGKPIAYYAVAHFEASNVIDEIVLVTKKDCIKDVQEIIEKYNLKKVSKIVIGGETRQLSVRNALKELTNDVDYVLIHDGARPFVSEELIERCIEGAKNYGATTLALPCYDTTVISNDGIYISEQLDRKHLWSIQTPQCFELSLIKKAHKESKGNDATDDAQLVRAIGHDVALVKGDRTNIKVTTIEDVKIIEAMIEKYY